MSAASDDDSRVSPGYLASILATMLVLPVVSIVVERFGFAATRPLWELAGKWFIFWAVGARLTVAGARQLLDPSFTARDIFHLSSPDAEVIVRELGLANICMGLGGSA